MSKKQLSWVVLVWGICLTIFNPRGVWALPNPVASYFFEDTLSAEEAGVPALVVVDPLGLNTFESDSVYGQSRQVYHFDGNASPPTQQAGLSLDTTNLVDNDTYSVELVFEFLEVPGSYRRILDVQNRQSDTGFYVRASNKLTIFNVVTGQEIFTMNTFHHVVLVNAAGQVTAYLDGVREFSVSTPLMNINNSGNLLNFFLDDLTEFADGKVALIRLYSAELSAEDVGTLASNPFSSPSLDCEADLTLCQTDLNQCDADLTTCTGTLGATNAALSQCNTTLATTQAALAAAIADTDHDGLPNLYDHCPGTGSGAAIDDRGCSLAQFCSAIGATTTPGKTLCKKSDWRNDEPIMSPSEEDCIVAKGKKTADDRCVPR